MSGLVIVDDKGDGERRRIPVRTMSMTVPVGAMRNLVAAAGNGKLLPVPPAF